MDRARVLGVGIDRLTADEAVARLEALLAEDAFHHVATPNNEMLVAAARSETFRALLNRTVLNLADSTGVVWASRRTASPLAERVTGVDTVTRLCARLGPDHPVFLLGAAPGVAEKAADVLKGRNTALAVAGTFAGSPRDEDAEEIVRRVVASRAHLLLVAYGSPAQEEWIDRHRGALAGVRVAVGVGGTFDFLAGTRSRAPEWMRGAGLEWAWRLLQEPSRLKRIWTAVAVFPWLVLSGRDPDAGARGTPPPTSGGPSGA